MGLILDCPLPDQLEIVPLSVCQEHFGQIKRFLPQRVQPSPTFANLATAKLLANWTPFLTATDETIITAPPLIDAGFTIPEVAAKLEGGGDDTTLDGMPINVGLGDPPRATGHVRGLTSAQFEAWRKHMDYNDLTAFFVSGSSVSPTIWGYSANGITIEGIRIYSFHIGDPSVEGHDTHNKFPISFSLPAGWRTKLVPFKATDFNPLTIVNS